MTQQVVQDVRIPDVGAMSIPEAMSFFNHYETNLCTNSDPTPTFVESVDSLVNRIRWDETNSALAEIRLQSTDTLAKFSAYQRVYNQKLQQVVLQPGVDVRSWYEVLLLPDSTYNAQLTVKLSKEVDEKQNHYVVRLNNRSTKFTLFLEMGSFNVLTQHKESLMKCKFDKLGPDLTSKYTFRSTEQALGHFKDLYRSVCTSMQVVEHMYAVNRVYDEHIEKFRQKKE